MPASTWDSLSELVVVAGHAVLRPGRGGRLLDDDAWVLQAHQRGEPPLYVEHVRVGVELAAARRGALLVFSGGQTRADAGPCSEGQSYWAVAEHFGWWSHNRVRARSTTEEYAADSFENLLFGICRFRECTGRLPGRVVVVGWEFKRTRFGLHCAALSFPPERFEYVGANDPAELASAQRGERQHGVEAFLRDPFGLQAPLAEKRAARNPFRRRHGYASSCPELRELLANLDAGHTPTPPRWP